MAEYIKKDDAISAIKGYCDGCNSYNGVRCRACSFDDAMVAVDSVSAADIAPVRHGHWLDDTEYVIDGLAGTGFYPDVDCCTCSVCYKTFNKMDNCTELFDYCPNCGAKMDKEGES